MRCKTQDGRTIIPDGAVVCRRGKKAWTCLVEVKTGAAALREEQVGGYLDIARERAYDGVLTISNQITAGSDESPVSVDGRSSNERACGTSRGGGSSPRLWCRAATAA